MQTPTSTSDTLRLLATDRADIGIVSLLDFLTCYQQRQPITAFMALEQRPLGSLLALEKSGITSPKDLEGQTVGVTGVPSDLAAVNSMVSDAGGDPGKSRRPSASGTPRACSSGRRSRPRSLSWTSSAPAVSGAGRLHPQRHHLRQPRPGLCLCQGHGGRYASAIANPDQALDNLTKQAEGLALSDAKAQYEALKPVYQVDAPVYGALNLEVLGEYLTWAKEAKILDLSDDPAKFATDKFMPSD